MPLPVTVHINRHWVKLIAKQHAALKLSEARGDLRRALSTSPNRAFQDYRPKVMPRKKKRAGRPTKGSPQQPSPVSGNSDTAVTLRFACSAAQNATGITVGDILAALGSVVTVSAVTARSVFTSFKLKRIQIWSPATLAGETISEVLWATKGNNVRDDVKVNSTVGTANAGAYVARPPAKSFSSMWWDSSDLTAQIFEIVCPTGSIVDLTLIGSLANSIAQPGTFAIASAGAIGQYFNAALDQFSAGTHTMVPQGRSFLF
jgi:hypothetical protein